MNKFRKLFTSKETISETEYTVSSTKRQTLIIPKGIKVFDEGNSNWYVGDGSTTGGIELSDNAGFSVAGDVTQTAAAIDWDMIDNNASALSFDASGKAGILELVTTNSGEGVKMAGTLAVTGASTLTGATYTNGGVDRSTAAALAVGGTNANAVDISKAGVATTVKGTLNVDQAATFDTTVGVTGTLSADGGVDRSTAAVFSIGTATASSVNIGRSGSGTTIKGNFTVNGTATFDSTITASGASGHRFVVGTDGKVGVATSSPSGTFSVGNKVMISTSTNPDSPPASGVVIYVDTNGYLVAKNSAGASGLLTNFA